MSTDDFYEKKRWEGIGERVIAGDSLCTNLLVQDVHKIQFTNHL